MDAELEKSLSPSLAHVNRVFSIQEERQAQYHALRKVQQQCASQECSIEYYNSAMTRITATFQALSKEMVQLTDVFCKGDLLEVPRILMDLQHREKDKLSLTVKWQVMMEKHRAEQAGGGPDAAESVEVTDHERSQLRRRLATVEGAIAELLQDFKFECESILTD